MLQAREGRRLVIVKCEKIQLAALAEWISQVLLELGRPGHLPEDFALEPEYESDFVAGDIAVSIDEEAQAIDVTIESVEEDSTLNLRLSREWAGGLAIAIVRLVEAGHSVVGRSIRRGTTVRARTATAPRSDSRDTRRRARTPHAGRDQC